MHPPALYIACIILSDGLEKSMICKVISTLVHIRLAHYGFEKSSLQEAVDVSSNVTDISANLGESQSSYKMNCYKCGRAASDALEHIFLPYIGSTLRPTSLNKIAFPAFHRIQHRSISGHPLGSRSIAPSTKKFGPASLKRQVRDEEIQSRYILLRENGPPNPHPVLLSQALRTFDRKKYFLVQVYKDEETELPVCKIIKREVVFEQDRASNKPTKTDTKLTKSIEMGWRVADGDLKFKMGLLRDFLEEGKKVEVIIVAKKKRQMVEPEEAIAFIQKVRRFLSEVKDAKESAEMEGKPGKMVTLFIEGPHQPKPKVVAGKERKAKVIEMHWGVTDEEIEGRLVKIRDLLASEIPVDILIRSRGKGRTVTAEEGEKVLQRVSASLERIPGIRESQPREGDPGKSITIFLG
jgi:translation initiation factor IF-3